MSSNEYLHTITEEDVERGDILSNISPEIIKSTYNLKKTLTLPLEKLNQENFKFSFRSDIAEGILGFSLKIFLPELNCKKEYLVSWKKNISKFLFKKISLVIDNIPFDTITGHEMNFHRDLMIMDADYPAEKIKTLCSDKPSKKIPQKKLSFDIPFSFSERPSLFLQTFRCVNKKLDLNFDIRTKLEKLVNVYKTDKSIVEDFDLNDVLENIPEIEIGNLKIEVISKISNEDKTQILSQRKIELVDVYSTTTHYLGKDDDGEISINIFNEVDLPYHTLIWENETSDPEVISSLENEKDDIIFQDLDYDDTHFDYPKNYFRRIPYENENLHAWTNCFYYNDMGAKSCRPFGQRSKLTLKFKPQTVGKITLTRITQLAYVWESGKLVLKI